MFKAQKCTEIIERLYSAVGSPIEFRNINLVKSEPIPYVESPLEDSEFKIELFKQDYSLRYLIAALLSRGIVVKDRILSGIRERNIFMKVVMDSYRIDKEVSVIYLPIAF